MADTPDKPKSPRQRLNMLGIKVITDHTSSGRSMAEFCKEYGFARVTVTDWIAADKDRQAAYDLAKENRADVLFDELDALSEQAANAVDGVTIQGIRLKCDNIKWKLAVMNARKYGKNSTTVIKGDTEAPNEIKLVADADELLKKIRGGAL